MSIGHILECNTRDGWCRLRYTVGVRNYFDNRWNKWDINTLYKSLRPVILKNFSEVTHTVEIGYYNVAIHFFIRRAVQVRTLCLR